MSKKGLILILLIGFAGMAYGQTPLKEARNSFALYTKSKDIALLEKARKQLDGAFLSRRDSQNYKNNLARALIYSSLAYADSNRRQAYKKDPVDESLYALAQLQNPKLNDDNEPEISYVKKMIAAASLVSANRALRNYDYQGALRSYLLIDSLGFGNDQLDHNLAMIYERAGNYEQAITRYEKLLSKKQANPVYYMNLADLYTGAGNEKKMIEVLEKGRANTGDRNILFRLINYFADKNDFPAVLNLSADALKSDPNNLELNYLVGFAFEMTGKQNRAEEHYRKIIGLDMNNYNANYALGLLHLSKYLKPPKDDAEVSEAKYYLSKANEINPNDEKALQALIILYTNTGNMLELQRTNEKLNQLKIN